MSSATAYIGIGLPGSGKTTYLRQLAEDVGAIYISSDDIRSELYRSSMIWPNTNAVWEEMSRQIRKALRKGDHVVIDSYHTKLSDRERTLHTCRSAVWIEGIWYQAPFGVCVARNQRRAGGGVSHLAMRRMRGQLYRNPPSKGDGFDQFEIKTTA